MRGTPTRSVPSFPRTPNGGPGFREDRELREPGHPANLNTIQLNTVQVGWTRAC